MSRFEFPLPFRYVFPLVFRLAYFSGLGFLLRFLFRSVLGSPIKDDDRLDLKTGHV